MRPLLVSLMYNAPMPREQIIDRLSGPKAKELACRTRSTICSAVVRQAFRRRQAHPHAFTSYMHVIPPRT